MEASCCYVEVEFPNGDAEAADSEVTQAQHSLWNGKYHIYRYVGNIKFFKFIFLKTFPIN